MKSRNLVLWLLVVSLIAIAISGCGKKCDHTYTSSVTKEATCAEEGVLTYTCSKCGHSYTEAIPQNDNHQYASKNKKEATCGEDGIISYVCDLCGDSYDEVIPKTNEHVYISEVSKEAKENQPGVMTYTCSQCGDSYAAEINWFKIPSADGIFGEFFDETGEHKVTLYCTKDGTTAIQFSNINVDDYSHISVEAKDINGNEQKYTAQNFVGVVMISDYDLASSFYNGEIKKIVITLDVTRLEFEINNVGLSELLK